VDTYPLEPAAGSQPSVGRRTEEVDDHERLPSAAFFFPCEYDLFWPSFMDVQSSLVCSPFLPLPHIFIISSQNTVQSSSSSPSSATNPPPSLPVHPPTSEEIDAVIQQATSAVSSDGRHVPLKDTRTQLFVGNVRFLLSSPLPPTAFVSASSQVFASSCAADVRPPAPCSPCCAPFAVSTGCGRPLSRFNFHVSHSSPDWEFGRTDLRYSFRTGFGGRTSKTSFVRPALFSERTSP
jgi:hypothetical protein